MQYENYCIPLILDVVTGDVGVTLKDVRTVYSYRDIAMHYDVISTKSYNDMIIGENRRKEESLK